MRPVPKDSVASRPEGDSLARRLNAVLYEGWREKAVAGEPWVPVPPLWFTGPPRDVHEQQ